jgi:DNA-binding winged helix-turn-helix (wHTH) protein
MEGDFRIGQWLVQPQLNTIVSPDNTTVQLEPRVMEVLAYLADRAGEVVSKESLLQALWGDAFVTENALTRCIAELRKVFQDDADEPRFIQTISKKAYRLVSGWQMDRSRGRQHQGDSGGLSRRQEPEDIPQPDPGLGRICPGSLVR